MDRLAKFTRVRTLTLLARMLDKIGLNVERRLVKVLSLWLTAAWAWLSSETSFAMWSLLSYWQPRSVAKFTSIFWSYNLLASDDLRASAATGVELWVWSSWGSSEKLFRVFFYRESTARGPKKFECSSCSSCSCDFSNSWQSMKTIFIEYIVWNCPLYATYSPS